MEKFYFESPSLERKNEIIEYLDEFVEYGSNINGSGSLDKIYDGYTFEETLERCLNMENEEYSKKLERCPARTFLLIRASDNKIVGTINIRWNLNEKMLQFGGHIGYGIRPTERRKGYNKINLYLGLKICQKYGIKEVLMDCDKYNLGSAKTIQALGGVKIRECYNDEFKETVEFYSIDVDKSLSVNKELYEK